MLLMLLLLIRGLYLRGRGGGDGYRLQINGIIDLLQFTRHDLVEQGLFLFFYVVGRHIARLITVKFAHEPPILRIVDEEQTFAFFQVELVRFLGLIVEFGHQYDATIVYGRCIQAKSDRSSGTTGYVMMLLLGSGRFYERISGRGSICHFVVFVR